MAHHPNLPPGPDGLNPPLPFLSQVALLPRDSPASRLLQDLLTKVRLQRSSFMRLRVARKGDPAESAFFAMLVEDRWGQPGPCGPGIGALWCAEGAGVEEEVTLEGWAGSCCGWQWGHMY